MQRCRFDTLGKSTPAHRAGAPTARGRWVSPRPVGESDILIAKGGGPPTARGHLILPDRWVDVRQCPLGCPKKNKSPNFGMLLTPVVFIGQICIFGIFGHIWPYLAYLGTYLGTPNMVKWGVPEKILQNAVQTGWS